MKKVTRGSEIIDAPHLVKEVVELHMDPKQRWETIGFRLAHDDSDRVNRGGSWFSTADFARAATRSGLYPGFRVGILGFRLTRPPKH